MRAYVGPPVVQAALASADYAAFGEVQLGGMSHRERQGIYTGPNVSGQELVAGVNTAANGRLLTDEELWAVYRQCPDVRASIDAITREISTWDWDVIPSVESEDPQYELAEDVSEETRRFLSAPNEDGETWQTLISKLVRDLLIYDALAGENVLSSAGELEEVVTLPGGTVEPVVDRRQRVLGYRQEVNGETIFLDKDRVLYLNLFPNTLAPGGTPLIETILNEIITLLRASKHLMLAYDADEIAPGVLLLAGIGGPAATKAVEGLRNMRGADHKLRVLTTNNPKGLGAEWVQFRHTPKDLDMKELVHDTRRTVWRLFGVKPVSMGDTEATPRATAQVQVDAQDSGLLRPILELLQAMFNMRLLPLVVGDSALSALVEFQFDLEKAQGPEDRKVDADVDAIDFDRAGLSPNELRSKRGRPLVEGGDIPLIKQGGSYVPLTTVTMPEEDEPEPEDETTDDEDGGDDSDPDEDGGATDPEAGTPDEGEEAPGEADADRARPGRGRRRTGVVLRHRRPPACSCGHEPHGVYRGDSSLLPSDWQPGGRFEGYRTLDLRRLGDSVISYRRAVSPLYRRARIDVSTEFQTYLADGVLDATEGAALSRAVAVILDRLEHQWSAATEPLYRDAARIGRDAASSFNGLAVVDDWRVRADLYHDRAMSYLTEGKGLIGTLRAQIAALIGASIRGSDDHNMITRQYGEEEFEALALLAAVDKVFGRNEHRIDNWSGKLVELGNASLLSGMGEGGSQVDEDGKPQPTVWMVEWVSVGDFVMCPTCGDLGSRGIVPLPSLPTEPGGATECGGRCRCVLVFWTEAEVKGGTAVSLSNTAA